MKPEVRKKMYELMGLVPPEEEIVIETVEPTYMSESVLPHINSTQWVTNDTTSQSYTITYLNFADEKSIQLPNGVLPRSL